MLKKLFNSSIGRKIAMALSGIFLIVFLTQHFLINITSVFSESLFNWLSHFMGTNPLVQFVLQPILIAGVLFHFVMGFILDYQNRKARPVNYAVFKGSKNSLMVSRYMILSGTVILSFLALHFYDFWIPEMEYKYIQFKPDDPNRYHHELVEKFQDPVKVGFYCISFIFLALHLVHGLASSTQSLGTSNKYSSLIKKISYSFGIVVPLGFCFIAVSYTHLTLPTICSV